MQKRATRRWFSPGIPVSSTNKTDHDDITEILVKVVLNAITLALINGIYETSMTFLSNVHVVVSTLFMFINYLSFQVEATFADIILYSAVPIIIATIPDNYLEFSKWSYKGMVLSIYVFIKNETASSYVY